MADADVTFVPPENRTEHESRYSVVVSGDEKNCDPDWPLVLIVPCSGSSTLKTALCVKLAAGEGNLPRKCWARIPMVQAATKISLADKVGQLETPKLEEIMGRLVEYMDLA